ncbi:uncharacterized protein LOC111478406 [Cucurbita maxima]|uniref:Uncharacterized protein LOC111478406 n=1 Tax=Cucurbita maxima TaxID=3661 RepID=A0A6J1IL15_CUCMA|nr:uncharacterized protein LOC111478406 [Cucurbita maxima]XP_022978421.1 uncharacterized protein LOC111478406 [Cucurbita maxima]XP_022978430.1 uncharacterized protein LOC111478406 [Cucurbita maxima]
MAATGRCETSSHSTKQPDIIGLGSTHSEDTAGEGFSLSPTGQLAYGSSSCINLMELSDLVQVDENVNRPEGGTICLGNPDHDVYQLQFKDDESDVSSLCSAKSEKSSGSQGPTSASQVSDITHESGGNVMSPTQSPPLQTMDRVGGYEPYDPLRIPSAVFQRSRSTTPLEWSIASNESLFSIHGGDDSFSGDNLSMLSDLGKSDELLVFNSAPAVITSRETEMKSVEYEEEPKVADTTEYNIEDREGLVAEDLSGRNVLPPALSSSSSSRSRHSERSQCSSNSFAFPILADEEAQDGSVLADDKIEGAPVSTKSHANSWFPCCSCSCYKWNFYSRSCCKWTCCSCSSCCTWNCYSCNFRPHCHFCPRCRIIYPCHFCRG